MYKWKGPSKDRKVLSVARGTKNSFVLYEPIECLQILHMPEEASGMQSVSQSLEMSSGRSFVVKDNFGRAEKPCANMLSTEERIC